MFNREPIELWVAATSGGEAPGALTVNVSDLIGLIGNDVLALDKYEIKTSDSIGLISNASTLYNFFRVFVNDTIGLIGNETPLLNLFEIFVNDTVGLIGNDTLAFDKYEIKVSDNIGISDAVLYAPKYLYVDVLDGIGLRAATQPSAWLGISSSDLLAGGAGTAFCGEEVGYPISDGLDAEGNGQWRHDVNHTHYCIFDFGTSYNITRVRGRSNVVGWDPNDVDIYISSDGSTWESAVASDISTWVETGVWQEVDTTDKIGRYLKVEIPGTVHAANELSWGTLAGPCFDAFGYIQSEALTKSVSDNIGLADVVYLEIPILEINVNDTLGLTSNITTLYPLLEINVSDTIGLADTSHIHQVMHIFVSDAIGSSDTPNLALDLYEIYVTDLIGTNTWAKYIIPGAEVIQLADIFRYPHVDESLSDELKRFFYELENSLKDILTGDSYLSGTVNAPTANFGDINNRVNINKDGVTKFIGRAGLLTSDIYVKDVNIGIALAAESTYYQVTAWSEGSTNAKNGISIDAVPDVSNDHITIKTAGLYRVNWHVSAYSSQKNEYEFEIFKNDGVVKFHQTEGYRTTSTAAAVGAVSGGGNCHFNVDDTIELWVERKDGGGTEKTITIRAASINILMIGG